MAKRSTWDREKARELYDQGLWDSEIARQLGNVRQEQITRWRTREGLPKNPVPRQAYSSYDPVEVDRERLRELHMLGMRDLQIARAMGISKHYAQKVRRELGLAANGKRVPADGEMLAAYNKGTHDAEIARVTGTTPAYVKTWRERNNLPPHEFDQIRGASPRIHSWGLAAIFI